MSRQDYISDPSYPPNFRFSLRAILIAFVVIAPILWLVAAVRNHVAAVRNHSIKHEAQIAARTKAIWATLNKTAKDAEQIRTQLGRAPISTIELENLLGHPISVAVMPDHTSRIYYERTSNNSYNLVFSVEWLEGFSGDFLMFQSNKPRAGWAVHYD
jgi:hypothetical protein